tara:strand:+ start:100 stop:870 length:771 start_codon:yes stop_codon:yes gene_type:complete
MAKYIPANNSLTTVTNATNASIATNVTVADESTDTSCNVLFVTSATGNLPPKSGTNLTFNSNTGDLNTSTLTIADYIVHDGDTTTKIGFPSNGNFNITTGGVVRFTQTNTRSTFSSTDVTIPLRRLDITGTTAGEHDGDVVKFGGTESLAAGRIYYYDGSGWALADADAESTSKGLLAVALGEDSDEAGMLIKGMVTLSTDPGSSGDRLFVSETGGQATATAPTGSSKVVRRIGYCLNSTNKQIYFNPDNHYTVIP